MNFTIARRPVAARASRTAVIVASVPVTTKRTISQPGTRATIRSASSISGGDARPKTSPRRAASTTAASTAGCPCPRIAGPQAQM